VAELLLEKSDLDPNPQNRDKADRELLAHATGVGSTRIVQLLRSIKSIQTPGWASGGHSCGQQRLVIKRWCSFC
jgi:hypothetical protein